jgi:hypothetical protein
MPALNEAHRRGGLYYTADGVAVDANGEVVQGAPKRAPNTDRSKQPGYIDPNAPAGVAAPEGMVMVSAATLAALTAGRAPKAPKVKAAAESGSADAPAAKSTKKKGKK